MFTIKRLGWIPILVVQGVLPAQRPEWRLGTPQIRLFTGFNLEDGRIGYQPSAGAGFDVGLCRWLAVTTNYGWSRLATAERSGWAWEVRGRTAKHDLLGGLRFQVPNRTRVMPHVSVLGGVTIATLNVFANDQRAVRQSMARPAGGAGAGFEVWMGKGWSILAEAKAIRPEDMRWYGYVGFGFAYRTPPRG